MNILFEGNITESQFCFEVKTEIKVNGYDISWIIGCKDKYCQMCANKQTFGWSGKFHQKCCLPADKKEYIIYCLDEANDGWHGGYLEINGVRHCDDFLDGSIANDTMTISNIGKNMLLRIEKYKYSSYKMMRPIWLFFRS